MDDMNIQGAEGTVANSPAIETKVDGGTISENVTEGKKAIRDAKREMFGKGESRVQAKPKPTQPDSNMGEEIDSEEQDAPKQKNPVEKQLDVDKLLELREKDRKRINSLTAQKYHIKEEHARLLTKIKQYEEILEKKPTLEDYAGNKDEYLKAEIRYGINKEKAEEGVEEAKRQIEEQRVNEWTERCKATVTDINKFATIYKNNYEWLTKNEPELMSYASESVVGPRILEEAFNDLFQNDDNYATWKSWHPANRKQYLIDVERKIHASMYGSKQKDNKPTLKSNAPAIIGPEKSSEKFAAKATSGKDSIAKIKAEMFGR